jgi:tetratricopeptide (TPR) repeat protein
MIFQWFSARDAERIASDLADQFAPPSSATAPDRAHVPHDRVTAMRDLLRRAGTDGRISSLNFYKKARFANSFKWRLLENGIEPQTADRVTHSLIMHLSGGAALMDEQPDGPTDAAEPASEETPDLVRRARKAFSSGAYDVAAELNEELVNRNPADAEALNNLGAALCKLEKYIEGMARFRQALSVNPNYAEASYNLGNVLRWLGKMGESEVWLRRALKLKPNYVEARSSLGLTLTYLGRLRDAKARFEKVLKAAPRNSEALFGMGLIAKLDGRFSEAESLFKRVLEYKPRMANAVAALATLKRMTPADSGWLRAAKELASGGVSVLEEADLRFSIGKYHDDLGEFDEAFRSFEVANGLLKAVTVGYDRKGRDAFVDDMLHAYPKDAIAAVGEGASNSVKPVFVLGMPRSGTSLAEQILASHPSIAGAGELDFWNLARLPESEVRKAVLDLPTRTKLAAEYLSLLEVHGGDRSRVIDKTPASSDFIGVIYSIFPNARFIYMERDPVDACMSCYFQNFAAGMNFSLDLSDLAHYFKGHRKLFKHWQSILPPQNILVVPYAGLVDDQQGWTSKMLDFIGLEWSDRCLSFYETKRAVVTASAWQVRQKMYPHSVGRSAAYKKFLSPLKALRN